jgi:hypothetical protein
MKKSLFDAAKTTSARKRLGDDDTSAPGNAKRQRTSDSTGTSLPSDARKRKAAAEGSSGSALKRLRRDSPDENVRIMAPTKAVDTTMAGSRSPAHRTTTEFPGTSNPPAPTHALRDQGLSAEKALVLPPSTETSLPEPPTVRPTSFESDAVRTTNTSGSLANAPTVTLAHYPSDATTAKGWSQRPTSVLDIIALGLTRAFCQYAKTECGYESLPREEETCRELVSMFIDDGPAPEASSTPGKHYSGADLVQQKLVTAFQSWRSDFCGLTSNPPGLRQHLLDAFFIQREIFPSAGIT